MQLEEAARARNGNALSYRTHESAAQILGHSSLRVTRQLEMLNVFLGFEQANKYALVDPQGNAVGFMAEELSFMSTITRQFFRLHRPFRVHVLDLNGKVCMNIWRNFSIINSRIFVADHQKMSIGESQQEWHPWRRRYNLFIDHPTTNTRFDRRQFAAVDAPFLSWDFPFMNENGALLGGVYRDFAGIGMELFSDYGLYAICFDRSAVSQRYQHLGYPSVSLADRDMDLDERAVALAAAVSIDFDYFSRHSSHVPGGFMFFPMSSEYTDGGDA
ncbi:hypothetical protein GGI25_003987 [Coemansia spiralis]|uniref:Phospholipid scramblase n=2 Tax=Coemansia TaxID=4863 RepID=A0A9W8G7J5_9FUNG|nr:hypothetical protein GGI26_004604 [Coemansia sp. RSA 1358]KAJ2675479.1 hypothetical protein GGI25_003987 [Coemansia spiralis]